jgi:hypothetical protein
MRSIAVSVVAAIAALGLAASASAAAAPQGLVSAAYVDSGVYHPDGQVTLDKVQFIIGSQQYCWYPNGWRGPGFYLCGYAFRRGFGWGGPYGWNGWGGGYPSGWRGGNWHGRWYGARGGGWRGGGFERRGRWDRRDRRDFRRDRREDRRDRRPH